MINKLKWAYRLLLSRSYVILLDRNSVISIPVMDTQKIENLFLLTAQAASLVEFKRQLEDLIHEHENEIRLLSFRKKQENKTKKPSNARTSVRKNTSKKRSTK